MKKITYKLRALTGCLLALIVAAGPALRTQAGSKPAVQTPQSQLMIEKVSYPSYPTSAGAPAQAAVAGVLTTSGNVKVNDNPARTGTTVLNASTITTAGDGRATIDLETKGLLDLGVSTVIWLNRSSELIDAEMQCCGTVTESMTATTWGKIRLNPARKVKVSVTKGNAAVFYDGTDRKEKDLAEGKHDTFDAVTEVNVPPGAIVTVDCGGKLPVAWYWGGGLLALLGVVIGIVTTGNHGPPPPNPSPTPPIPTAIGP